MLHIEIKDEPLAYQDCPMLVTNDMNVKCELIQDVEIKDEEIDIQEEVRSLGQGKFSCEAAADSTIRA